MRAGKQAKQTAVELGIHPVTLSKWLRQDDIDHGRRPGTPTSESTELRSARRRIRELETELAIVRQVADAHAMQLTFERGEDGGLAVAP